MRKLLTIGAIALAAFGAGAASAETGHVKSHGWHFESVFGTYNRAAAQRGYQIYAQVCAACHSLSLLSYRNLMDLDLTENQVKSLIAEIQVPDLGDDGAEIQRPARLSDKFKKPYANDLAAAAANGGKAPPDLSVMIKAREGGADYVYALLTSYVPFEKLTPQQIKEAGVTKDDNYNAVFPGHRIAMPPPLSDDKVQYADGTKATLAQEAADVVEFLAWASEPHLEARKRTGVRVILFLIVLAGFMYAVKRQVWADKH